MGVRDTHIVRAIDAAVERRLKRERRSSGLTTVIQGANDAVTPPVELPDFSSIDAVISETEPDTDGFEDGDIWIEIDGAGEIVGVHFLIDGAWSSLFGLRSQIDASGGTGTTYGALAGAINGANTTFTVSQEAYISGTLKVWLNGMLQLMGSDGDFVETTPASGTFDFLAAPPEGCWIIAEYRF